MIHRESWLAVFSCRNGEAPARAGLRVFVAVAGWLWVVASVCPKPGCVPTSPSRCSTSLTLALHLPGPWRCLRLWPWSWTCCGNHKIDHLSKARVEAIRWLPMRAVLFSAAGDCRGTSGRDPTARWKGEAYLGTEVCWRKWAGTQALSHLFFLEIHKNEHFPFFFYLKLGKDFSSMILRELKSVGRERKRVGRGLPSLWLSLLIL